MTLEPRTGDFDEVPEEADAMAGMVRVSDWDRHNLAVVSSMRLVMDDLVAAYRGPNGRGVWARPEELEAAMATHGKRLQSQARARRQATRPPAQRCSICRLDMNRCQGRPDSQSRR